MAYSIGQFNRSQLSETDYLTTISCSTSYIDDEIESDDLDIDVTFKNFCIYPDDSNTTFTSSYSYYLNFTVKQMVSYEQKFTLNLVNTDLTEDDDDYYQEIKTLSVTKGNETSVTFELIFHPNATYTEIVFDLQRIKADFLEDTGENGRVMEVTVNQLSRINNIIPSIANSYTDLEEFKKIGIQGPPGMMFVLDGEEMRIGRTGIYELYNEDITISYLGFVVKESTFTQDGLDFFILDFKY